MANDKYPNTTQQPLQTLDFILDNGMRVGAVFTPRPDPTGQRIEHVDLDVVCAGTVTQIPMPKQKKPQTIVDAARLALQFAESEASRVGATITTVRMAGDEFLKVSDVDVITNHRFPVVIV